jgi:hypothetical protein
MAENNLSPRSKVNAAAQNYPSGEMCDAACSHHNKPWQTVFFREVKDEPGFDR